MKSTVVTAVANIQAMHKSEMLSLREMIKKSLLLRKSPPDPDTTLKAHPGANFLSKTITERWNQADLGYFNPHLDTKAHDEGKMILVGKNMYYRNVMLFVQCI